MAEDDHSDAEDERLFEEQRRGRLVRAHAFLDLRHNELQTAQSCVLQAERHLKGQPANPARISKARKMPGIIRSSPRHSPGSRAYEAYRDRLRYVKAHRNLANVQKSYQLALIKYKQVMAYVERLEEVDYHEHQLYPAGSWCGSECGTDSTGDTDSVAEGRAEPGCTLRESMHQEHTEEDEEMEETEKDDT
ncbi:unnamed protein product [Peniophora sp. CBMAI 1063]|nr:unnamed protein product [Peniophora sp. CBMAI 1063]